jgi:hypothetical protein
VKEEIVDEEEEERKVMMEESCGERAYNFKRGLISIGK